MDIGALDDTRSLNEAKEICWNDKTCSEFYKDVWGAYIKCAADSKRDTTANNVKGYYVKGMKYIFCFDFVIYLCNKF